MRRVFIYSPAPGAHNVQPAVIGPETFDAPSLPGLSDYGFGLNSSPILDRAARITPATPPPPHDPKPAPAPSGPIRVSQGVQMAKLVKRVIPEYPPLARSARVSGTVHLVGIIAKDGAIRNLELVSGHPLLTRAALEAVAQWIFKPTLLNGEPVEVIAPIDVNFSLGQ